MDWGKSVVIAGMAGVLASQAGVVGMAFAAPAHLAKVKPVPVCIKVHRVTIEGVHLLALTDLEAKVKGLAGRCLNGTVLNEGLKAISFAYIDKGYITARAYVPAQNLKKTKTLRLVVIEGQIAGFYADGKPALDKTEITQAFPGLADKPLNMRDLEQGLDQMNSLSGVSAKTDLVAAKTPGGSFVNVTGAPVPAVHLTLSNDNHGSEQTGLSQSNASLSINDIFDHDESLSVSYGHTGPDYPFGGDYGQGYSNSFSGNLNIPYGYWTAGLHGNHYVYESKILGLFSPLQTSGSSDDYGGSLSRVIHRDQNGKTSVGFDLDYKASDNFLLGNVIETGTRRYTVASISLDQSQRAFGGLWSVDLTYAHGLGLFGATLPGSPGVGGADPLFGKVSSEISYLKPFAAGPLHLEYSGRLSGQWSPSNLLGSEQISIGGFSTVRGTRDALAFGNDGAFLRNQVDVTGIAAPGALAPILGELRPYVGFDCGHIFGQDNLGIVSADAAGWTVGLHNRGGRFGFDAGYSSLVVAPGSAVGNGVFFASGSLTF